MDVNVTQLRAAFEPFDLPHLLALWAVLTIFIFLWGLIVTSSGSYPTARWFWKIHLRILGAVYALSGIGFLLLNIDPLLLLLFLLFLSFTIQSHTGITEEDPADWWAFRLHKQHNEEPEESEHQTEN